MIDYINQLKELDMLDTNIPCKYIPLDYHGIIIRIHKHSDLGNIWFCLSDICKVLRLSNPSSLAKKISIKHKHLHKINDCKRNISVLWVSYKGLTQLFDNLVNTDTLVHLWYWCRKTALLTR